MSTPPTLSQDISCSLQRIFAMLRRHWYLLAGSWTRVVELILCFDCVRDDERIPGIRIELVRPRRKPARAARASELALSLDGRLLGLGEAHVVFGGEHREIALGHAT